MKNYVVLLAMLVACSAEAASFDCALASSRIDTAICASQQISKLDSELAAAYQAALAKSNEPDGIKTVQRLWLKQTRNACPDEVCLLKVYQQRIAALAAVEPSTGQVSTDTEQEEAKADANAAADATAAEQAASAASGAQDHAAASAAAQAQEAVEQAAAQATAQAEQAAMAASYVFTGGMTQRRRRERSVASNRDARTARRCAAELDQPLSAAMGNRLGGAVLSIQAVTA